MPDSNLQISNSNSNIELSEAQEYYLGLFRKWQSWQDTEPQKLPEGYRSKEEFDFGEIIKNAKNKPNFFSEVFLQIPNLGIGEALIINHRIKWFVVCLDIFIFTKEIPVR